MNISSPTERPLASTISTTTPEAEFGLRYLHPKASLAFPSSNLLEHFVSEVARTANLKKIPDLKRGQSDLTKSNLRQFVHGFHAKLVQDAPGKN